VDPHLWGIEFIPVKFTPEEQAEFPEASIYYVVRVHTKRGRAHVYQDAKGKQTSKRKREKKEGKEED
jgi:hypothetical protein